MPQLTGEILGATLAGRADVMVVGRAATCEELVAATEREGADAAIVGLEDGTLPRALEGLMRDRPRLCMLGLADHGRSAILFEMRPARTALGELSGDQVVDAIHRCARRGTADLFA